MKDAGILTNSAAADSRFADLLRLGLLACALAVNFVPLYQFIGSMIWFREYLGDYQVFWGISSVPLDQIYDHHVFAYPPTALLLLLPFGLLTFWASLIAWSSAGAVAISCALRPIVRPLAIAIGFLTYTGIGVLAGGQISLFVGALAIAALSAAQPRWRGTLFAVAAAIKPQSMLAAPLVLLAERNWRAIGWALIAGAGLLFLSVLLFGLDPWLRWAAELPRFREYLISRGVDRLDVGVYGLVRSFGLPGWMFLFCAPLGVVTGWLVFRSEAPQLDKYAAFAACGVLMSPYTLYYDLAGLTFACVALLLDRDRSPLIWLAAALVVSSVFASLGIILLCVMLGLDAARRSTKHQQGAPSCQKSPSA